jgi:ribosomal silencing factor RsfS
MSVRTTASKPDGSVPESSCLALDSGERLAVVDDKVIACVLSERHKNSVACHPEREHDCQGSSVAYIFRMLSLHIVILDNRSDSGYDDVAPE